jgi:AcrR family transcriptional regulator
VPAQTTRRRPVQARSAATYEAVVEAAAQVFERHGYARGTTNRIAERAGVSIGTLYQYFADKDAVLRAVAEHHVAEAGREVVAELARLDADPEPAAALAAVLRAVVALHRDRPRLHRLLFEEAPLSPELRGTVAALETGLASQVAAWLARRPSPPADPALTATLLVQAVEAWAHRFVIHPSGDVSEDAFVAEAARLLSAAL